MGISKEEMGELNTLSELLGYLSSLKGWGIKKFNALIVEWEDEDGFTNWCDDEWTEGYTKRCYRDTVLANDILKTLKWDRKLVRFIKKEEK